MVCDTPIKNPYNTGANGRQENLHSLTAPASSLRRADTGGSPPPPAAATPFPLSPLPCRCQSRPPEVCAAREDGGGGATLLLLLRRVDAAAAGDGGARRRAHGVASVLPDLRPPRPDPAASGPDLPPDAMSAALRGSGCGRGEWRRCRFRCAACGCARRRGAARLLRFPEVAAWLHRGS
jgi:hypothetical protein